MRILIAEDDFASRKLMQKFLSAYGECDVTIDGIEAVEAYIMALDMEKPYDLVCLDVMMPRVDGIKALKSIREFENIRGIEGSNRAKVIIVTALANVNYISDSFQTGLEAHLIKPIDLNELVATMEKLGLK
ncbi:response regulator [Clostridium sp. PL3]|uniref:Response regulator n=1 Tax=Clostridium thailandense TaxID=2794346 RepID=A0A949TMV2_9CLOT|nr:response regulator [Clostridium thailandense]MBV7273362.1 response regulator [Clostridium thailandense]